ncbi:MAG: septal ring lytic transglycosylase RlpA family protein [Treponema sp.]|jgi:rare lipoprotein A|nr:septal ring lytic transglycosylase RlpA family protein [Treponema sp.]
MKRIASLACTGLVIILLCVPGTAETQEQTAGGSLFRQEGIASWYGPEFDGQPTASGEIFNSTLFTAAHPTLPFGTTVTVTNKQNNRKVTVRVNDRGPFVSARIIDVSRAAAVELDIITTGTAPVIVEGQPSQVRDAGAERRPAEARTTPVQPPLVQQSTMPRPALNTPQSGVQEPELNTPRNIQEYSGTAVPAVRFIPAITPEQNKVYRLQIGSYKVPRNAMDAFEKLRNAGLSPAYERNGDFYRVVLAGIRAEDINPVSLKIGAAGFSEALIREER